MRKGIVLLLMCGFFSPSCFAATSTETLTLTTYYPSPYGVYREMRTKRMAIGENYYNAGTYAWASRPWAIATLNTDASLLVEGKAGINTSQPQYDLDVNGDIKARGGVILSSPNVCDASHTGSLRYVAGTGIQYCDGSAWQGMGGTASGCWVAASAGYQNTIASCGASYATGGACYLDGFGQNPGVFENPWVNGGKIKGWQCYTTLENNVYAWAVCCP